MKYLVERGHVDYRGDRVVGLLGLSSDCSAGGVKLLLCGASSHMINYLETLILKANVSAILKSEMLHHGILALE